MRKRIAVGGHLVCKPASMQLFKHWFSSIPSLIKNMLNVNGKTISVSLTFHYVMQ